MWLVIYNINHKFCISVVSYDEHYTTFFMHCINDSSCALVNTFHSFYCSIEIT